MEKLLSTRRTYGDAFLKGVATFFAALLMAFALRHYSAVSGDVVVVFCVGMAARIGWESAVGVAWLRGAVFAVGLCILLWILLPIASHLANGQRNPWAWLFSGLAVAVAILVAQVASFVRHQRIVPALAICLSTAALITAAWKGFPRFVRAKEARQAASLTHRPLPPLQLTDLHGTAIPESQLAGHVTVINFWGTWCVACVAEMPDLESISKEYPADKGVKFLLVNSEVSGDDPAKIRRFIERKKLTLPVALDPSQSVYKLGIDSLPLTLVVDREAQIRFVRRGFSNSTVMRKELHSQIDSLLISN